MRSLLFLLVMLLYCKPILYSQVDKHSLNYSFGITRFDFFTGLEYQRNIGRFDPFIGFEVGVNRTFFQQRFFPKFKFGTHYFLLRSERILLGPTLNYGYSLLNVNKSTASFHRWHEVLGGIRFLYGGNFKIGVTFSGGWTAERFPNQFTNSTETVHMSAYTGSILVSYAL
jgi:hypothetical protein